MHSCNIIFGAEDVLMVIGSFQKNISQKGVAKIVVSLITLDP